MTVCVHDHFSDCVYWQFVNFLSYQSIYLCAKSNIAKYKTYGILNLCIDRTCVFPLIQKHRTVFALEYSALCL